MKLETEVSLETEINPAVAPDSVGRTMGRSQRARSVGFGLAPTLVLVIGALYCLFPVLWLPIAATKNAGELFTTFSFWPSFHGGFISNIEDLFAYNNGAFVRWAMNSLIYAGGGSVLCVIVSASAGYALAKYRFRGRSAMFTLLLSGVLIPPVILAIPQYLLLAKVGLAGTYWSVLLPSVLSPFGIFLCRAYASAAVPDELLETGRLDGAGELRLFLRVAIPLMAPGLVTVMLLQFVAIWNNFLLPFLMLSDDRKLPLTVGLYAMLNKGPGNPVLFNLAIMGSLLSIVPIIVLFLTMQRYWRMDLISGGVKG